MRLQASAGRRAAALRQYHSCVAALQRELGILPELETTSVYRAILDWRPEDLGADRSPSADRTALPFVGRGPEVERLEMDLAAAWNGAGGAMLVTGAAGIGKSRLVEELARRAAARGRNRMIHRFLLNHSRRT